MSGKVLSMFTGAGGMDTGARALGLDTFGAEIDPRLASIAQAAGHHVEVRDVRTIAPPDGRRVHGAMGGPPCQTFSPAGKGDGRVLLPVICELARTGSVDDLIRWSWSHSASYGLVLEPLRIALMMGDNPLQWLALEQVPPVLPVWEAVADRLRAEGYSVATGVLKAEEYGVPQTRRRAVLLAAFGRPVRLPAPTHRAYRKGVPQSAGNPFLHPWVSMADALGWGATERPSWTVCGGGTATGGAEPYGNGARRAAAAEQAAGRWAMRSNYSDAGAPGATAAERGRTMREQDEPACTITSKGAQIVTGQQSRQNRRGDSVIYTRETLAPSPTVTSQSRAWELRMSNAAHAAVRHQSEPAPTVVTGHAINDMRVYPEGTAQPGQASSVATRHPDSRRLTIEEAATLQSFPDNYPWWVTPRKGDQFLGCGNAVPPVLWSAVLREALR